MLEECPIVIVTYNRAGALRQTLERLHDLPERPPLLVIDNGSTDETERTCKPFGSRVRFFKLRRNIGAAARTIGAREAGTPFVAFCDDDCAWMPGSLQLGVDLFKRHPDVAVLNGRVLIGETDRPDPACQEMRAAGNIEGLPGVPIVYFMAGASVMRRAPFLDAGGYDARYFIGAEESLLSLDLAARGWQIWYCDDLIVRHYASPLNRDPETRRRLIMRNRLWTTLLRRSAVSALQMLAHYAKLACSDRIARAALREAIAALPWILRERKPIPFELERRVRAVDSRLTT
jgi:GT2 family glycosyltransferase